MRIIHVVMSMMHGGSERLATDLAHCSQENGHEVIIVVLSAKIEGKGYDATEKGKNLKIIYTDKKDGVDAKGIIKFWKILNEFKPDVIHTHIDSVIYAIPWYVFNKNVIKIHTVHNEASKELSNIKKKILKVGYKFLKVTPVAISDKIRATVQSEYNIKKNNIELIYNGIDITSFKKKNNNNNEKTKNILHVGRFFPQKNHKLLLEAFSEIIKIKPDINLILIGEGPLLNEIKELISRLNLKERVKVIGATNEMIKWYNEADIFVLPSKFEGLPLVILEAYCFGLPVVATRVGGVEDVLVDKENGFLVESDNKNELVEAILRIIEEDNLRKMFENNNIIKSSNFDIKNVTKKYEDLYNEKMSLVRN